MTAVLPPNDEVLERDSVSGARSRRRRREDRRRLRRRIGFASAVAVLAASIPALAVVGFGAVLDSTDGKVVDPVLDPDEPNFEAVVEPTPVALLVLADDDQVSSLTVLSLGRGDSGGGMLFVPVDTVVDGAQGYGIDRLATAFALSGVQAGGELTGTVVGTSFDEVVALDQRELAQAVVAAAPLTLENPDDLDDFAAGPVELEAADVGAYLDARQDGESDLARLARHEVVWRALLDAWPDASDADGSGLSRYLDVLSRGTVDYRTLPVTEVEGGGPEGETVYQPEPSAVAQTVTELVPLPTSATPGDRVRVRLLDGGRRAGAVASAIARLVAAGAEITIVGNADRFDHESSSVLYGEGSPSGDAERLRDTLGVGSIEPVRVSSDAYDVTVVLGTDFR
jgi:hypothetical protein